MSTNNETNASDATSKKRVVKTITTITTKSDGTKVKTIKKIVKPEPTTDNHITKKNAERRATNGFNDSLRQAKKEATAKEKKDVCNLVIALVCIGVIIVIAIIGMVTMNKQQEKIKKEEAKAAEESSSDSDNSEKMITAPAKDVEYQSQSKVGEGKIPDHYRGKKDAKNKVIIYADYTCPYCITLAESMSDLHKKYDKDVMFIYRHYHVGHTYSEQTTRIAEAAYLVGGEDAFWKMTDKLFNDSSKWESGSDGSEYSDDKIKGYIRDYAKLIGIDAEATVKAYDDYEKNGIQDKIDRDSKLATDSGISGTPTVFVNRDQVSADTDEISSKLDDLLGK